MSAALPFRRRRSRAGIALLEAIIALALLGIAGGAGAVTASELTRAVARVQEREALTQLAERLLTAVSLWPGDDLDRHLGWTAQGPLRMWIDRIEPVLYQVALSDGLTGGALLQTTLFRPGND